MPTSKGHFKPWALLTPPETGNAFRFVYPTLAVVGVNAAWLFDVERAQMVKTINYIQKPVAGGFLGAINYVELSDQHVLICGSSQLRFFDRSSGAIVHAITREDVTSEESRGRGVTFHRHTDSLDGGWGTSLVGFHPGVAEPDATDELEFVAGTVLIMLAVAFSTSVLIIHQLMSTGRARLSSQCFQTLVCSSLAILADIWLAMGRLAKPVWRSKSHFTALLTSHSDCLRAVYI